MRLRNFFRWTNKFKLTIALSFLLLGGLVFVLRPVQAQSNGEPIRSTGKKLITVYDRDEKRVILTDQNTVETALKQAGIELGKDDRVEPDRQAELTASKFNINIYRAQPVVIVDGAKRIKIMSSHRSARQIVSHAGLDFHPEDEVETRINFLNPGESLGVEYVVKRSKALNLVYFGKAEQVRTQAATVGEFLDSKKIILTEKDEINFERSTSIVDNMTLEIWQEGKQEVIVEEEIDFIVRAISDHNRPIGYRSIEKPGVKGKRMVVYEIEVRNGREISRKEVSQVIISEPVEQTEVVGVKSRGGLTKSRGVNHFTDSKGVTHRETYYDLPMGVVMRNCGQGGYYSVREDGVKVDRGGYVIVAAHLGNYPRCSVVETSLGLGKVYDTGGFVVRYPTGFDIATDWSNYDGR